MSRCKSCGQIVKWVTTKSGKLMPVNVDDLIICKESPARDSPRKATIVTTAGMVITGYVCDPKDVDVALDYEIGSTSHFATCPNAAQHRRPRS